MATWKLTPDTGQISGSHSNMPLVVIPSLAGVGTITLAEAESSRFYTDSGLVTEVPREVVGSDEIHHKPGTVDSLLESYMDFDGVRADYAVGATYGRNAVWGDYYAVWHFADGSGTTLTDSSGNGYTGTLGAGLTWTTGKIGGGVQFNGSASITIATDATYDAIPNTNNFTLTAWSNNPNRVDFAEIISWSRIGSNNNNDLIVYCNGFDGSADYGARVFWRGAGGNILDFRTFASGWQHTAFTSSADTAHSLQLAGVVEESSTASTPAGTALDAHIGSFRGGTSNFDGVHDAIRISKSALSTTWIADEYRNQNDQAAFWVAMDVTAGGGLTLPANQGTYTTTGQATALTHTRSIAPDAQTYATAGQSVALRITRSITSTSGIYATTGIATALRRTRRLTATHGTYATSGQPVSVRYQRILPLNSGTYATTGFTMGFVTTLRIKPVRGTYTTSGQSVAIRYQRIMPLDAGTYATTGQSTGVLRTFLAGLDHGTYTTTGTAQTLRLTRAIQPVSGVYEATGSSAAIQRALRLDADSGTYLTTGIVTQIIDLQNCTPFLSFREPITTAKADVLEARTSPFGPKCH